MPSLGSDVMDKKTRLADYQRARKEKAMLRVMAFYREHPFSTVKQCANALDMNYQTVARYVKELRDRTSQDLKS